MTNYQHGHDAETVAADYLREHGYAVVERNWRTRYCEIDIIATKGGALHFVEVKARSTTRQGSGLDYITQKKLRQMAFAAELWVAAHSWDGPYQLSAFAIDAGEVTFIEAVA